MAAGSILIDLILRTGSFETNSASAQKRLRALQREAEAVGKAIGVALVAGATAVTALAVSSLNSLDALKDLSDATGSSVENLSALESIAKKNGQTLEDVGQILVKFNNALKEADGKNAASRALKNIGLDAEKLKKLDPAVALLEYAKALDKVAADGESARQVQELFGKSVQVSAPFLKDLAEAGALNATATTAQAEAAEAFKKQLAGVVVEIQEAARGILGDLLPAVTRLISEFNKARNAGQGSLLDGILGTSPQANLQKRAEAVSQDMGRVIDSIQRMQTELDRSGDNPRLANSIGKARDKLAGLSKEANGLSNQLKELANAREPLGGEPTPPKPAAKPPIRPLPPPAVAGKKTATPKDPDQQVKDYLEELKRIEQATSDAVRSQEQFFVQQQQNLRGYEDEAKAAKELADTFGFTADQLDQLNITKTRASALSLEKLALDEGEKEGNAELAALYRAQAKALGATADEMQRLLDARIKLDTDPLSGASQAVKDYLDAISKAGRATYDITRDALEGFEDLAANALQGKNVKQQAKRLVSDLINEFFRLRVIKPMLNDILGGGGSGGGLAALLALFSRGGSAIPSSSVSSYPQFASGTPYVPRTGLAMLHEGERVLTRKDNASGWGETVVNVINTTGASVREERSESGGKKMIDIFIGALARDMGRGGQMRKATREAVGPRPRRG